MCGHYLVIILAKGNDQIPQVAKVMVLNPLRRKSFRNLPKDTKKRVSGSSPVPATIQMYAYIDGNRAVGMGVYFCYVLFDNRR